MKHWRQTLIIGLSLAVIYYFFSSYVNRFISDTSKQSIGMLVDSKNDTFSFFDSYIAQAKTIETLKQENKILHEQATLFYSQVGQLKQDSIFNNFELNTSSYLVNNSIVNGYSSLPNLYRVWLNMDTNQTDKNFGLIVPLANKIDSVACGVATYKTSRWEGYLNGDTKATYTVFIGQNKAPGIIQGHSSKGLLVAKYIPAWVEIKVGDEVVASGVDKLFFEGVKVGIVKEVNSDNTYNEALIEPYCNSFAPSRYFAIRKND